MATLKEISKEIIDSLMETAINDNRYYPLKFLMENLQIFAEDFVDVRIFILIKFLNENLTICIF